MRNASFFFYGVNGGRFTLPIFQGPHGHSGHNVFLKVNFTSFFVTLKRKKTKKFPGVFSPGVFSPGGVVRRFRGSLGHG